VYRQTILTSVRLKGCEIVGNVGTLTTVTGGSLSVGEVKWDTITIPVVGGVLWKRATKEGAEDGAILACAEAPDNFTDNDPFDIEHYFRNACRSSLNRCDRVSSSPGFPFCAAAPWHTCEWGVEMKSTFSC